MIHRTHSEDWAIITVITISKCVPVWYTLALIKKFARDKSLGTFDSRCRIALSLF